MAFFFAIDPEMYRSRPKQLDAPFRNAKKRTQCTTSINVKINDFYQWHETFNIFLSQCRIFIYLFCISFG